MKINFADYRDVIESYNPSDFLDLAKGKSLLAIPELTDNKVRTYYAPFDYINHQAKLVLVGITPGQQQMNKSLFAACSALHKGSSDGDALKEAKVAASFDGKMRPILIDLLDRYRINSHLGIASCSELWGKSSHLVHFTSCLRNPVFRLEGADEKNYTGGSPTLAKYNGFSETLDQLSEELTSIPNALILPLGCKVAEVVQHLVTKGSISLDRALSAEGRVAEFPHPSGQNGETISLASYDNFPEREEYSGMMLNNFRIKKGNLTKLEEAAYVRTKNTYWERVRHTRLALQSI